MSMTKRDFVEKIARATGLLQQDVAVAVQKLLDTLADEVAALRERLAAAMNSNPKGVT